MYHVNNSKGVFSLLITALILISFFSILLNAEEISTVLDKKVLIIHSYHQGLTWTGGQDEGVREILTSQQNIEIFTEYLDTKRIALEKTSDSFAKFLKQKYATTRFDAVMVTDNNALTFLSKYHSALFPDTPVVFSGINNYHPDMLKEFDGLATGVIQTLDPKGTFDLIRKLQPGLKSLVVVSGTTPTAQAIRDKVKTELAGLEESQRIMWLDGLEIKELLERLSGLSKNDAVLLCNFNRDGQGNYYSHKESGSMISKASNAPVYAMEDHYLSTGVTGGYMNSSRDQGIVAGRLCLEILQTAVIPKVVTTSPNAIMFDYRAMTCFGLDVLTLPPSAIIINRPVSFYEQYKTLIWNTVVVFCLLLLALLGVSFGLMRARQAERELRRNEENLHTTLNSIGDAVMAVDTEGRIVRMNPVAEKLTGWELVEAKGKPLTEVFHIINAQAKEPTANPVNRVLETGKIVGLANHTVLIAKNGVECQIADSAAPILNADESIIGVVLVFRDVTEEYQMQKELLDSEKRLRILFEQAADAIYVSKPDGELVRVNDEACRSMGYTKEELLGSNVSDVNAEMTTPEAFCEFVETLSPGQPVTVESSHRRKDGSIFPVEVTVSCLEIPGGPNILAIVRDVTERKQAEKALQESENQFRDFFANAPIGFHIFGTNQTIIDINDAELDMIGYTRDEIVGKKTWPDLVIPAQAEQFKKHWNDIITRGSVRNLEYTLVHKQGHNVNVLLNASSRFDEFGQFINSRGSILNITERKRAEEALYESEKKYRTLFEQSADATLIIEGGKIIDCNQATVEMLGYVNKEELLEIHPSQLSPELQPDGRGSFEKANEMISIATERGSHRFEWAHKRRNGEVFPAEILLTNVALEDRNFLHVVWRDITDRKRAEDEREQLVKVLEYKNKELQDIVYTASHDLRSPLVNIQGFSGELKFDCDRLIELLVEKEEGIDKREHIESLIKEDIPECLKFITNGAKKMSSLLDGLLQISRIGTVKIHSESLDIDSIAREVLDSMEYQINASDINVTVDPLPKCIGDAHMMDHVFTNLISNAIKYRDPEKEGIIRISGKIEDGMSIYSVEDNGIGIDPDHQKKVFEIFHRLNPHDSGGGEGLGLTIVTRIMDRLGGKIWLESEPDKDSKFYISLPAV